MQIDAWGHPQAHKDVDMATVRNASQHRFERDEPPALAQAFLDGCRLILVPRGASNASA
jgi:hypothetical protein